jgi:hypothetical protein
MLARDATESARVPRPACVICRSKRDVRPLLAHEQDISSDHYWCCDFCIVAWATHADDSSTPTVSDRSPRRLW